MSATDCPLFPTHSPADLFADQSFADPFPLPAECRRCYGMMGWRMGYLAYDESSSDLPWHPGDPEIDYYGPEWHGPR